jgi:RNA polymerase sigma factor (sigma-70 family)
MPSADPRARSPTSHTLHDDGDSLLATRAKAGDATSFALLIDRHSFRLAAHCRALMRARDGAEDLYQETVLRAFSSLRHLDAPDKFLPWLLAIASNLSKWWWRRATHAPTSLDRLTSAGGDIVAADQPEHIADAVERSASLISSIANLPGPLRHPLILHYVEGLSYAEIATALNLPVSTIKGRLFKARSRLRIALPPDLYPQHTTPPGAPPMTATHPAPQHIPTFAEQFVTDHHRRLAEWHHDSPVEPFDADALRVLSLAEEHARQFKHGYFGTEHILLGLLDDDCPAAQTLSQLGITAQDTLDLLSFAVGPGEKPSPDTLFVVPRVKATLEHAVEEARRLGSTRVGAIHLLLGVLAVRAGFGALMLATSGVTYETVRQRLAGSNGNAQSPHSVAIPPELLANPIVRWATSQLVVGREADILLRSPALRGLKLPQVLKLLAAGQPALCAAGEQVMTEGQPVTQAHVLLRGRVTITKEGTSPPSSRPVKYPATFSAHFGLVVFGAAYLIDDDYRAPGTATTIDISETLTISRESFRALEKSDPALVDTITRNIEQSLTS